MASTCYSANVVLVIEHKLQIAYICEFHPKSFLSTPEKERGIGTHKKNSTSRKQFPNKDPCTHREAQLVVLHIWKMHPFPMQTTKHWEEKQHENIFMLKKS